MYYNTREEVIQLFEDYATIAFEARYRAMEGEEFKTLSKAKAMKKRGIKILPQNKCCKH